MEAQVFEVADIYWTANSESLDFDIYSYYL